MSTIDYHLENLVNQLRVHANDDDEKILSLWAELINVDILVVLAQTRQRELRNFQKWIMGSDNCSCCGKELPRLDMYAYQARTMVKVTYSHRCAHLWQDANGACFDCQTQYLESHTFACVDCGSLYFRAIPIQVRCENCQTQQNEVLPQNTRARKLGLPANLDYKQWSKTLEHFAQRCAYCGNDYEIIEHFTPLTLGGETSVRNCVPACSKCNSSKSNVDARAEPEKLARRMRIPLERLHEIQVFLDGR